MKKLVAIVYPFAEAENIIGYAGAFANRLAMELELIHTVEYDNMVWDQKLNTYTSVDTEPVILHSNLLEERTTALKNILRAIYTESQYTESCSLSVIGGPVDEALENLAAREDVEMVLLPNLQKKLKSYPILKLIEKAGKPVLSFPVSATFRGIKTIVYATDFMEQDIDVLKQVALFATKLEASVTLCHVVKNEDFDLKLRLSGFQELLRKKVDFTPLQVNIEKAGSMHKGIRQFSRRYHADLVVLFKKEKGFLKSLFGNDSTQTLLEKTDLPVLIYRK